MGDLISDSDSLGSNKFLAFCAYYSLASFSGLFVIPILAICSPVFILCAIATPIWGAVKRIDALLNLGIPYASYIGISGIQNPFIVFILCIMIGVALYLVGYGGWKLLVRYIKAVSNTKQRLSL